MAWVPDSLPDSQSQRYNDYGLEATQLSQPVYSQASQAANSQADPRRKYWALLIPINPTHSILKIPWTRTRLQIGRGGHVDVGNHVILHEKRVSNRHCRIILSLHGMAASSGNAEETARLVQKLKDSEAEPEVWIEDLKSSNGTFVNGSKITRRLLVHGDEVSLGHTATTDNHDVRYIFRSVGHKGANLQDGERAAGEVYERYQILSTLGKGTFAEVRKAVDVETGDLRAIKQIVKHRFDHNEKTLNLFQREIDICTQLHHENICRLIDWYTDPQHICLVLEYIDGGDLLNFIINYKGEGIPEAESSELAFQICRAMAYCHENGVTHRDLKPENILLTKETDQQPRIIKVADFGLAKMVHSQTMLVSLVGTPQYLAPEIVMQTKQRPGYENVVDSWSVGIIVYSMLTKAVPFDDSPELTFEQRIRQRYDLDFDREPLHIMGVSAAGIDFIARLLERDPAKRMTMKEALEHEWLAEAESSSLPNESPSQVLGGDSMWNIQSFESENDIEDEEGARAGGWSRPMTVSTNFETSGTGESFSQPMEGLRLESKAGGDYPLSPAKEEDEASERMEWDADRENREQGTAGPSPDTSLEHDADEPNGNHLNMTPTKANPNGNGVASAMDVDSAPGSVLPSSMDIDCGGSSVLSTSSSNKRKQAASMFSSGSLSPPPDERSERDTTPQPPRATKPSPPQPEGPRRLTRSGTAKATPSPAAKARVKETGTAKPTGARKSRRLG